MLNAQLDDLNVIARDTLPHMLATVQRNEATQGKIALLESWDCHMSKDSTAATLYAEWHKAIAHSLTARRVGSPGVQTALVRSIWYRAYL